MDADPADDDALLRDLFADSRPQPPPDNADPHPVTLRVDPRMTLPDADGNPVEHEAYFDVTVAHPDTCSGHVEECPVADYLDVIGVDSDFRKPFGEPDHLTDAELAALDGAVRWVVLTRHFSHYSGPNGDDWDVEYDFTWVDEPDAVLTSSAASGGSAQGIAPHTDQP